MTTKDEENEFIRKILKIREHPEEALFPNEYALEGPPKGRVYEKQPFKFQVEAGKSRFSREKQENFFRNEYMIKHLLDI